TLGSFGVGDGRSRTSRVVGQSVRRSGGTGLEAGSGRVGHHGWIARTGSHLSALLSPIADAALPEACQGQRLSAGSQTRARTVFQGSQRNFYAPIQSAARAAFFTLKQQWGRLFPSAVQIIEKDLDSLLTFFQFDPTYWTVLRTTNPIERLNKEFKRRTNAMEVTGGEISTYRCLAYVAQTM